MTCPLGVLIGRRIDGNPPWVFPGGTIEPGEDALAAAVREVAEETGLAVRATSVIGERMHPATGRTVVYVAAEPVGEADAAASDSSGLAEVRWVSAEAANGFTGGTIFEPVQEHIKQTRAAGDARVSMEHARITEAEVITERPKRFVREHVVMPDGYECDWYYTDTPPSVLVVPVTAGGNLVMVRQYRHNLKRHVLEFPAGMVDRGEGFEAAALRELAEETGYEPKPVGTLQPLGAFYSLPSETNKVTHAFLAEPVECTGPARGDAVIEQYFDMSVVEVSSEAFSRRVGNDICGMEAVAVMALAHPHVWQWNTNRTSSARR